MDLSERERSEAAAHHYMAVYKPFGILSQYSDEGKKQGLGSIFNLPAEVYPLGRLDSDSEGLLLLTSERTLAHSLLHPSRGHERSYLVQLEGDISPDALASLAAGVELRIDKSEHQSLPARVEKLSEAPELPERNPPVRFRRNIPTSWIRLTLSEGKNRQVRRMTAAVGFPTLRLVRQSIEMLSINGMQPGDMHVFDQETFYKLLNLNPRDISRINRRQTDLKRPGKGKTSGRKPGFSSGRKKP